ncbi:MAG: uncharacterized protein PWP23_1491 [Candidatus Sumerlaeota bacterium]|nr:uncharacterized protein [Candidatus Sumerlaeota bacterium]
MHILLIQIDLGFPASQSLKEKRSSLKSIIDHLRTRHNVTVAEVDNHDKWQAGTIAVVTVSNLRRRTEETSRRVQDEIEKRFDVVIAGVDEQWL